MLSILFILLETLYSYKIQDKHLNRCPRSTRYSFKEWECRLDVMTFIGKTINLNEVDFEQITTHKKRTLRIVLSSTSPILITPKTFRNLGKLEELDLDIPNLVIKKDSLRHLKSLKRLTLSSNNNALFVNGGFNFELFKGLHELTSLRIVSYMTPLSLPGHTKLNLFHSLKYLHELTLLGPEVDIPTDSNILENLKKLVSLNIYGALRNGINKHLFVGLSSLKSLEIHDKTNVLRSIEDGCFDTLKNLEALVIKVKLSYLPATLIRNNKKLNGVTLRTLVNHVDEHMFNNNKYLVYLDLSQNFMFNIPDNLLSGNKELRIINLSENYITEITHGALKGLEHLTMLYLNDNKIHKISKEAFLSSKSIELLTLNDNKLNTEENGSGLEFLRPVIQNSRIKTLDLKNNEGIKCVPKWIMSKVDITRIKLRLDENLEICL